MPPSRTLPPVLAPPSDVAAATPDDGDQSLRPRNPAAAGSRLGAGPAIGLGTAVIYLSLLVLIPLAAVVYSSAENGASGFLAAVTAPDARSALTLTLVAAAVVTVLNTVMGTVLAWVLVRDSFPGRAVVDALVDLPIVLPTIVAGLVLVELYGPSSPVHVNLAYTRAGVALALLFTTLPFVVRTVQPVLAELDQEAEQAAASLGASPAVILRRIVLPALVPAMLAGAALAFTRAIAEFGATVLISGNIPGSTQVASVQIFGQVESDNTAGAAAVSTVLLTVALLVLVAMSVVQRWAQRRG
jgi:sulfate/thiosulfate transport system permease protein